MKLKIEMLELGDLCLITFICDKIATKIDKVD